MKSENLKTKRVNNLILRHLSQIESISTDAEFGNLRPRQKYESFMYAYYGSLHQGGNGPVKNYYPFINLTLLNKSVKLNGSVLILKDDLIFNSLILEEVLITSLEPENVFYEKLLRTPIPMLFIPTDTQKDVNKFLSNIGNMLLVGTNEGFECLFMDPMIAYRLGLDFLIKDFIRDPKFYSLLLGFIYK
ncbi:hypothetical protein TCON_0408 [Astathelohania contejeani]|uniref:Uncharacterized protein n=1 Tax=Astathelohania contejeani TaxID=164912 RepID=A0ABQ7I1W4_9MICR|nr:hypothetical protein TCON_0408 [Thelohania contejeani]